MLIYAYWCGELDHTFTEKDAEQVSHMCNVLDDPIIDTWNFETDDGTAILFWRDDTGRIRGNFNGHDERDIPESSIANGNS